MSAGLSSFITIFVFSVSCSCDIGNWVCVIPTENSTCNCSVPCHTFEYYISNPASELYDITVEFLPGTHRVDKSFSSSNRTGLYLVGSDNAAIHIEYNGNASWFSLNESSNILISGLSFIGLFTV